MLAGERLAAARQAGRGRTDARLHQFYDGPRRVAQAVAGSIGWRNRRAWDIYLFYRPGRRWEGGPPAPAAWWHQNGPPYPDQAHRRCGGQLRTQLAETLRDLQSSAGQGTS